MEKLFFEFIKEKRFLDGISENTIRSYEMSFKKFQIYAKELSKPELNKFVVGMRAEGLKPGGCNVKIRSINSFLSWCHENEHTGEHLKIKQIKTGQPVLKIFSEKHIKALIGYKPQGKTEWRSWAATCLLIDCGARITEILELKTENIDLDQLFILVKGKGSTERYIPISREVRKVLWQYSKKRLDSDYWFSSRDGGHLMYRNYIRDLKKICDKLGITGIRISPHGFRHFFAVNYLRNGGDIYRLSRQLGHQSVSMTSIYLRSMGVEPIREAHNNFSPLSKLH